MPLAMYKKKNKGEKREIMIYFIYYNTTLKSLYDTLINNRKNNRYNTL